MAFSSRFLPLCSSLFLAFLLPLIASSSSPSPITIPLAFLNTNSPPDLYQKLAHLASVSLARAHHIKNPDENAASSTAPLLPQSYGGYSISLSFGTPPQTIPFVFDTGSQFVWFPCTKRYLCKNCSASVIPTFIPRKSSSVKIVGCLNPKCGWIHTKTDAQSRCQDCQSASDKNCKQICPPYIIIYGSGSTGGIAMVDTLDLPHKKVPDFLVGCSLFSSHVPSGIAGFGRGLVSLPNQLGIKKFSYCLLSHRFDGSGKSSSLLLDSEPDSGEKTGNLSYTPMLKNPEVAGKSSLSVYYYISLRKITVGGKKVKIPYEHLIPNSDGKGGTIVDSGSTFTFLTYPVYEMVISEIINQAKHYPRAKNIESITGLTPCFNLSGHQNVLLPEMKFHFKGGAEMKLPLPNYFSLVGDKEVACLTMVTDGFGQIQTTGPSIILGNFQMQNFYVEYDLKNERFGFRQQFCN